SPRSSRRTYASGRSTGGSTGWTPPFTRSSSTGRHREDVGEVDQPEGGAADGDPVALVLDLGQRAPELAGREQELLYLLELLDASVPLVTCVQRQAEHADRVRLARPEERRRHREVLVHPRERHRLLERRTAPGW